MKQKYNVLKAKLIMQSKNVIIMIKLREEKLDTKAVLGCRIPLECLKLLKSVC